MQALQHHPLCVVTCTMMIACGSGDAHHDGGAGDARTPDGRIDAAPACDVTRPFGAPSLVDGVNTTDDDRWGWETADQLTIYFARAPATSEAFDLYVATRAQLADAFTGARVLETSDAYTERRPIVTGDGLTLYLEYVNSASSTDIHVATRSDTTAPFSSHVPVANVDTSASEFNPWISEDGLTLYFTSDRNGFNDIFRSTRTSASSPFSAPVAITELNSPFGDYMGALSRDGLEIVFGSSRDTNLANDDIFHAVRATPDASFEAPTKVTELSDASTNEYPTWISPDRCQLMFTSNRGGGLGSYDIWIASRPQ